MALPADASVNPGDARGWIAQGRVRAAIRMSDGERMNAENASFSTALGVPEPLVALELDETDQRLYTLSANTLYREDLAGPCLGPDCASAECSSSNPGNRSAFVLLPASKSVLDPPLAAEEQVLDVRRIPRPTGNSGPERVLLLTSERMLILAGDSTGLHVQGQCLELHDQLHGSGAQYLVSSSDAHFNSLEVDRFVSVRLAIDHTGRTLAYLFANVGKYGHDVHGAAPLLLLGDLDAADDFAHPTLNAGVLPATSYAYWSPYDAEPPFTGTDVDGIHANSAYALAVRVGVGETEVYVGCGSQKQLRCVTAEFQPDGIRPRSTITLASLQDLKVVLLGADASDKLFVRGTGSVFVVDISTSTPTWVQLDNQPLEGEVLGDAEQVLMASGSGTARTLWTLVAGQMSYDIQAFDVSVHGPTRFLDLDSIWRCDGGVALDAQDTYVLTAGGVRHYLWDAGRWNQAGYQPTRDDHPGGDSDEGFSEQLELGTLAPGEAHLLAPANTAHASGLFDWSLDSAAEPTPGTFVPLRPDEIFPDWLDGDHVYTNDLAFLQAGSESYVALCPTREPARPSDPRESALVLYRRDGGSWTQVASDQTVISAGFASAIALADLDGGDKVAFVGTGGGLQSYALRGLASGNPTVTLVSDVPGEGTDGVLPTGSRLIVADTLGADPRYVLYDWDTATGVISASGAKTIPRSELGVPSGYGRTFRLRFDPGAGADGMLYDCNDGGVYQLRYSAAGTGKLEYVARWSSLSSGITQDCRVYAFGGVKRLLVTKDEESFAWLHP